MAGSWPVRFGFGMPPVKPLQHRREKRSLPVIITQWEYLGIRYTQTVLLTRQNRDPLWMSGPPPADAVVMVQLTGENIGTEYTNAVAGLSLSSSDARPLLTLEADLVVIRYRGQSNLLAQIEVASTGIEQSHGSELRFRGHMPPGSSGAMTVKIPLQSGLSVQDGERLREMDFSEELERVRRFWSAAAGAGRGEEYLDIAETGAAPGP
jgi:hypothetical protein